MLKISELPSRKRFRLIFRAGVLIVGVFAAFLTSLLLEEKHYYWAVVPAFFILLATLGEFVLADILTESLYPANTHTILQNLEADLVATHDKIQASISKAINSLEACDNSKVSGTFHLKVDLYSTSGDEAEQALVQVIDYSGTLGGRKWRFNPGTKGIIGRCLRTGKQEFVNFGSSTEYEERMLREFGFSRTEMEKHTRQARSYFAQPVYSRGRLVGVFYLFSTELQVFPLAANTDTLVSAANEIAAYLEGAKIV